MLATFVGIGALGGGDEPGVGVTAPAVEDEPVAPAPRSGPRAESRPTTTVPTTTVPPTTTAASTSSAPASTSTAPSTSSPEVDRAETQLIALVVADPDPTRPPYERDDYDRDGWDDVDGDCFNTRQELLIASSIDPAEIDGCVVVSGRWIDPYDGTVYTDPDDVTVDHVVPLAEAHRSGAWRWDLDSRYRFTNDETPGHLLLVGSDVNQSKADSRPDQWMPPDPGAHCQYAVDWITSKSRWQLTVAPAELVALDRALGTCTPATQPRAAASTLQPVVVITVPTTTTTTTIVPSAGPGMVELLACDKRAERVIIGNTGGSPINLSSFILHDEGRKHETALGGFGSLEPGQQLTLLSGPDATPADGAVVWTGQNVWNNDGDTATLIAPDRTTKTLPC